MYQRCWKVKKFGGAMNAFIVARTSRAPFSGLLAPLFKRFCRQAIISSARNALVVPSACYALPEGRMAATIVGRGIYLHSSN